MTRALLVLALVVAAIRPPASAPDDGENVLFQEFVVHVKGTIMGRRLIDVNADGHPDLVLATRGDINEDRRRELHLHLSTADGDLQQTPDVVVPVMDDVIAYAIADVRGESGREIVFLTKSGAWSYSPTIDGYRDNIARLVTHDSFYDVPDPTSLPAWRYVLNGGDTEALLLAERGGFAVWGGARGDAFTDTARFEHDEKALTFSTKQSLGATGGSHARLGIEVETELDEVFLEEETVLLASLVTAQGQFRSPALVDVNGDGRLDLLVRDGDELHVHVAGADGIPETPTRTEIRPDFLKDKDGRMRQRLVDVNGDGAIDIMASLRGEQDDVEAVVTRLLVLLNDGRRLYPETPDQVLLFEASRLEYDLADVSGDGVTDLVVTKYEMPSLTELATGFEVRRSVFLYLGDPRRRGRVFDKKPVLRDEQRFDLETLQDALVKRQLSSDLSGDGIADLVEIDIGGRIAVRRVLFESSFFGGDSWTLERQPWRSFNARGGLGNLDVSDLNADGVADLLTHSGDTLSIQLSRRPDGRSRSGR